MKVATSRVVFKNYTRNHSRLGLNIKAFKSRSSADWVSYRVVVEKIIVVLTGFFQLFSTLEKVYIVKVDTFSHRIKILTVVFYIKFTKKLRLAPMSLILSVLSPNDFFEPFFSLCELLSTLLNPFEAHFALCEVWTFFCPSESQWSSESNFASQIALKNTFEPNEPMRVPVSLYKPFTRQISRLSWSCCCNLSSLVFLS